MVGDFFCDDVWRSFWLSQAGAVCVLVGRGQVSGLLGIWTAAHRYNARLIHATKNPPAPNVNSAEVEKPCLAKQPQIHTDKWFERGSIAQELN
jgi:hypothetical protein